MIVFSMKIGAANKSRTTLLRTFGPTLGPTRVAPGCLDARLYSDLDKRKTLLLVEGCLSKNGGRVSNLNAISMLTVSMRLLRQSSSRAKRRWFGLIQLNEKKAWTPSRFIAVSLLGLLDECRACQAVFYKALQQISGMR
jgi:hypothetical protein